MKLLQNLGGAILEIGDKLIYEKMPITYKGWYSDIGRQLIEDFMKEMKNGKKTAKIPILKATDREKKSLYNAIKSIIRRDNLRINVIAQKGELWLVAS